MSTTSLNLSCVLLSSKDQDKTRPLSTLANLAIIITDVQDMDPIFINLPYSTNIYEHSPPVRPSLALWGRLLLGISYFPWSLCMAVIGVLAQGKPASLCTQHPN